MRNFNDKPKLKKDERGPDVDHVCPGHEQVLPHGAQCEFCQTVMG